MNFFRGLGMIVFIVCLFGSGMSVLAADNAQFVSCVIPETLTTDQVFIAQITMRNTGTSAWGNGTPVTLVSKNPTFNLVWGTYFITMGQGSACSPNTNFTFTSKLKAPHTPGKYAFIWQVERTQSEGGYLDTTLPFFGEIAAGDSILVTQRQEAPVLQPHVDSLLDSSDLEYTGSFKVPNLPGEEDIFTESGLALRTVGTGKHLFVRTGTYDYKLYEMTIPNLVKITNGDPTAVNTGSLVQNWGDLGYGTIGGEPISSNCGFWFEDSSNILFWTHYNDYFGGEASDFPKLMATRLNTNGTKTNLGSWNIPEAVFAYKSYWGGPLKLPKQFASTYTGGREMALGFGGYYSLCQTSSRGPALAAIARPRVSESTLDLIELMRYVDPDASDRDGNYLPVVNFWDYDPPNPWTGKWTYDDVCRAGVFIDLPDKPGYLAFVNQVIGRIGYDYGGYNTDGHTQQCWYFYDPKDLGSVALGQKAPEDMAPSSFATVSYPIVNNGDLVTGACFDSASRNIYVYVQYGQMAFGIDREPIIHVYHIKTTPHTGNEMAMISGANPGISVNPNPFNSSVTISFPDVCSSAGLVYDLKIFTIDGALARDFSRDLHERGGTSFFWNASALPSGIYIIRATVGEQTWGKEVVLIR